MSLRIEHDISAADKLGARQKEYLREQVLERTVDADTEGWQNWTREIHRVLTFELMQKQVIERS